MKLPKITEAEFTRQVIKLANYTGWLSAHFRPARTATGWRTAVQGDGVGFPDLVLVKSVVIVAELKVGKAEPRPEQAAWLLAFRLAGIKAFVWRPDDWTTIEGILKGEIEP